MLQHGRCGGRLLTNSNLFLVQVVGKNLSSYSYTDDTPLASYAIQEAEVRVRKW